MNKKQTTLEQVMYKSLTSGVVITTNFPRCVVVRWLMVFADDKAILAQLSWSKG